MVFQYPCNKLTWSEGKIWPNFLEPIYDLISRVLFVPKKNPGKMTQWLALVLIIDEPVKVNSRAQNPDSKRKYHLKNVLHLRNTMAKTHPHCQDICLFLLIRTV